MSTEWNEADLLGIDLDQLKTESPTHPKQAKNHRRIERQGRAYWSQQVPAPTTWVTLAQAANRFFVHPETIRRWIKAGHIDHDRAGQRIMVDVEQVEDWLTTRRETQTAIH
jgi:excisionase family DNA binding protein